MKKTTSSGVFNWFGTRFFTFLMMSFLIAEPLSATDYYVTGKITDTFGNTLPDAQISFSSGNTLYSAISRSDGTYSIRLFALYEDVPGLIELAKPYPNPFSHAVNIPFIINTDGDIRFSVYNFTGQKITELLFPSTPAGSYQIAWDGRTNSGTPVQQGYYIYSLTFGGRTTSGKLLKIAGQSFYAASTGLVSLMPPPLNTLPSFASGRYAVTATVKMDDYYPVRLTDITIGCDTVINFELTTKQYLPYRTSENHIEMFTGTGYRPLLLKGINLGSSPPGYFPGEIAYAIESLTEGTYEKWIKEMAEAGFNSIRIYTLHPPVFYEKLAEYNQRNPDNPLLLFQGIWLDEIEDKNNPDDYDLVLRTEAFRSAIREVIDCIHGNNTIDSRPGRAHGTYLTDVSRWTAGYITGREIMPEEIDTTDLFHPELTSFSGFQFSISDATASEVFITQMLDEVVSYENDQYNVRRPVSISSWPTLDPLSHPVDPDEDKASFDIFKIQGKSGHAGIFACYHAYPYYPNFISQEPSYQIYEDEYGKNSYLGYLVALKDHYSEIPLVIGEFGVPSSWNSAHESFSDMDHGGYSENQQGEKNMRLMHNILSSGCAGGFVFAWMDEWFKPTWLISYLEAYGFPSEGVIIPTRQLWHNLLSPEQNFGLLTFSQTNTGPFIQYQLDNSTGPVSKVEITNDNCFLMLEIETSQNITPGDIMMIALDTYLSNTGESLFPDGKNIPNRSEFLLNIVFGQDTAFHYVTEAYDMNGLTPRFNLSDPAVQKYKSTVTDGAPWVLMKFYNDSYMLTVDTTGKLPVENSSDYSFGERTAVAWYNNKVKIRLPWTLLHFYDPTQMRVIDGAETYDGGRSYEIKTSQSDGIALSVNYKNSVVSSTTRYSWTKWLIAPPTVSVEKKSYQIVKSGLTSLPFFAD